MEAKVSEAFAPAAISNFFEIHDEDLSSHSFTDFSRVGATGGGFVLSDGAYTRATVLNGSNSRRIRIKVNGDPNYDARTSLTAVRMLIARQKRRFDLLDIEQKVGVPIGYGFGASAASALSAVLAVASALGLNMPRERIAYFAHAAEIVAQTGLGTVSAIERMAGAGIIVKPGGPGHAELFRVRVPRSLRIVTASLAPYKKSNILSSRSLRKKVNLLGQKALNSVLEEPTLQNLLKNGRWFADNLGKETKDIRRLIRISDENGALGASQNMVGYSVHAIVDKNSANELAELLQSSQPGANVAIFDFGRRVAEVLPPGRVPYPTLTSSLV